MTDINQGLTWSHQGSELFNAALERVPDTALEQPTKLPGWTIAHLVAHVGYNATALSRLMHWARTGTETPMYPSGQAREQEIESGARLPADELRAMVLTADQRLRDDFAQLPPECWDNEIITAQGVPRRAAEIPWMRTREVWIHAVDLGEAEFDDFPGELVDALITDVTGTRQRRQDQPALLIRPDDREREWRVDVDGSETHPARASAAELCRWLTGRGTLPGSPNLSAWL